MVNIALCIAHWIMNLLFKADVLYRLIDQVHFNTDFIQHTNKDYSITM